MGATFAKLIVGDADDNSKAPKKRLLKIVSALLVMAVLIRQWLQRSPQLDSKMVGRHLIGWTAGGVALNVAVKLLLGKWGERDIDGSPLWSWIVGMFTQQFVFPLTMMAAGVRATPESTAMRRLCFFIFWSYMTKDFFFPMKPLFWAHHLVSTLCIFLVLFFTLPEALFDFAVHGVVVSLEYGSLWNAVGMFLSKSKVVLALFLGIMSASNIYTLYLLQYIMAPVSKPLAAVFCASTLIITGMRQKSCMEFVRSKWSEEDKNN